MKKTLYIALALIIVSGVSYSAYQTVQANIFGSGLVLWYTMDSNDVSGTSLLDKAGTDNATLVNAPPLQTGILGQSLGFNGTAYGTAGTDPGVTNFTVSAWIKSTNGCNGSCRIWTHQGSGYWGLGTFGSGGTTLRITALSSADSLTFPGPYGPNLNDSKWHLLADVRDTVNGKFNFYVDGVLVQQTTIVDTSAYVSEGGSAGGVAKYDVGQEIFPGAIDDIRLYNVALTQADIYQLYNQGIGHHHGAF